MRTSLALGLSTLLVAAPALGQYTAVGTPVAGTPGVPAGAGGTSAAFGGGTMGPYSGSVPGGSSAATAGGTMGPTTGGGYAGYTTGSGYQPGPFTSNPVGANAISSGYSSGLNTGSLGAFNSGSLSLAGSSFANQSTMQPVQYALPASTYAIPSIVPVTAGSVVPSSTNTVPVDNFTTTPSTGFAIPQAGVNVSGTIRNSAGVPTQP
jgi:hypothetical protein